MKTVIEMAREAGYPLVQYEGTPYIPPMLEVLLETVRADAIADEREAMMQLFTDPENQPTQHGTVTLEYMQREIAAEREACAELCVKLAVGGGFAADCATAIRARSNT